MKPMPPFNPVTVLDQLDNSLADFRTVSSALLDVEDDGVVEPIRRCLFNSIRRLQGVHDEMYAAVQGAKP